MIVIPAKSGTYQIFAIYDFQLNPAPARYSFAHGGKDAIPYPVDRPTYDQTIATMQKLVQKMKIGYSERNKIINRLI